MNLRSSEELSRILSSCLTPVSPLVRPASLHALCLRTAAVYATAALYEFHDKQTNRIHQGNGMGVGAAAHGAQMIGHVGGLGNNVAPVPGGGGMGDSASAMYCTGACCLRWAAGLFSTLAGALTVNDDT